MRTESEQYREIAEKVRKGKPWIRHLTYSERYRLLGNSSDTQSLAQVPQTEKQSFDNSYIGLPLMKIREALKFLTGENKKY